MDVFIHEMVVPPAVWAYKNMGLSAAPVEGDALYPEYAQTVQGLTFVQNSSHTPQGAFGYLLSQIVSVTNHCPTVQMGRDLVWSFDLMALRVFPDRIEQRRLAVSDYSFNPPVQRDGGTCPPKYNDGNGSGNPYAQIDTSASISPTNTDGSVNYRIDGY